MLTVQVKGINLKPLIFMRTDAYTATDDDLKDLSIILQFTIKFVAIEYLSQLEISREAKQSNPSNQNLYI